jgi:hypothetical protein
MLDQGLSALFDDLDASGLLDETLVVALGEFGRSPKKASPPPATTTAPTVATTGLTATPPSSVARASSAVTSTANPTPPAPRRPKTPCIRWNFSPPSTTASASIPKPIVYNHLNQPRELVKAKPVTKLFA